MPIARQVLLHIGLQKTGSTALQETLFIDRSAGFCSPFDREELMEVFVGPSGLEYDPEATRQLFHLRTESIDPDGQLVHVLSHECLVGNLHAGGAGAKAQIDRLKETFPEATVLLVIREQVSLAASAYKQALRDGATMNADRYFETPKLWQNILPRFRFEYLEYDKLVRYLQDQFGADRVCVLPYEWFARSPDLFFARLGAKLGRESLGYHIAPDFRLALPTAAGPCLRFVNRLLMRNSLNASALLHKPKLQIKLHRVIGSAVSMLPEQVLKRAEHRLRAQVRRFVGDRYAASNTRLEALIGIDLKSLGYSTEISVRDR